MELVDTLRVDSRRDVRIVALGKCERQGEADLPRMARFGAIEEAFVFIPALCAWIETGVLETPRSVQVDRRLIQALLRGDRPIVLYHVHPGNQPRVLNHFPAYKDLLALALINGQTWRVNPNSVVHRAVTKFGIIEYRFANPGKVDRLVSRLVSTGLAGFISQNLAFEFLRRRHRDEYLSALRACESMVGDREELFSVCFPLETDAFVLDFKSADGGARPCPSGAQCQLARADKKTVASVSLKVMNWYRK